MNKNVKKLISNLEYQVINGELEDFSINKVCYDSREAEEGDLFICLFGARFDSHSKIEELINKKVKALIVNRDDEYVKNYKFNTDTLVLAVEDSRKALAIVSANYFDNPTEKLKIIGVTGTKGKTTTSFMISNILREAKHKVGLIGTIGIFYGDEHILTNNTTPESYVLQEYFRKMLDIGIEYVVMEVSSQSLKHHRVYGINFYFAVWTNIKSEHIGENEHDNYEDYLRSKLKIFGQCQNALINAETDNYEDIVSEIKKHKANLYEKKENRTFTLKIPGTYNQENASLAYEFGKAINVDDDTIRNALAKTVVPGRIETVYKDDDYTVIVDYSYDPNGAKRFLETIKNEKPKRIVTVFGCGGNRSKDRRYGMGEVCGKMADFVILTADNSRYEKTRDIIRDIETTLTKYKKENDTENGYVIREDRKEAIEYAIKNRKPGDVICVMGKGHEPMMEENGKYIRFLDKEVILDIINSLDK